MKGLKAAGSVMAVVFTFSSLAIAGEVKDREVTQETNLQAHETKIEKDRTQALSDGKVTRHERRKLHREEHRQSKRIHHKKHNTKAAATEPTSS